MRGLDKKIDHLHPFEQELLFVCSKCEPNYSFNGVVGFLYESAKDQLEFANLSIKDWINFVMDIGRLTYMDEKDFAKQDKKPLTSSEAIAAALVSAFGDGKK